MKTVQDLIDHLQTLQKDLPIGRFWDESGEFFFAEEMPSVVDFVEIDNPLSRDGRRWVENEPEYFKKIAIYGNMKVVRL